MDDAFRVLTSDEFDDDWRPIRDAIFGKYPARDVYDFIEDDYHVGPPDWVNVAIPERLFYPWGREHYLPEKSNDSFDEYGTLLQTLGERGSHPICASTNALPTGDHVLFRPVREAIHGSAFPCFGLHSAVFDASGEWGLCDLFDNVGVLGGNEAFMAHYLRNAGGLEAVIRRFHDFDIGTHGWAFLRKDDQHNIDAFYDIIGWPRPDYPPDQQVPNRKPPPER